jgi:hypothetical protein
MTFAKKPHICSFQRMKRVLPVVVFVLACVGEARAVSCDEFVKFVNAYNLEAGGLSKKLEAYGPSQVCRFGREVGFPFLKKAISDVKEFTACPKYGPLAITMLGKLQENLALQEARAVKDCSE